MNSVYLAGPIQNMTDAQCKDWREEATRLLSPALHVLDPMRRDYRGSEYDNYEKIVADDLLDIALSKYLLVNAGIKGSWGTAMELVYAYQQFKTIVAFNQECPMAPISPWLRYHVTQSTSDSKVGLSSVQEACSYILSLEGWEQGLQS